MAALTAFPATSVFAPRVQKTHAKRASIVTKAGKYDDELLETAVSSFPERPKLCGITRSRCRSVTLPSLRPIHSRILIQPLMQTKMTMPGKGILAMDESNATCGSRLEGVGVEIEENRRRYRELLIYDSRPRGAHRRCYPFRGDPLPVLRRRHFLRRRAERSGHLPRHQGGQGEEEFCLLPVLDCPIRTHNFSLCLAATDFPFPRSVGYTNSLICFKRTDILSMTVFLI